MKRHAFTLIELLVVVATIAILFLIVLQAVGGAVTAAREAKTKTILFRLRVQMEHKAQALQRLQMRTPTYMYTTTEMTFLNANYASLPETTKVTLAKKLMLGHYFPQDLTERWDAKLYRPGQTIEDALLRTPLGPWFPDDDLTMLDAWGNPIVFLRWPTQLFAAHPELLPAPYDKDPDDPLFALAGLFTAGQPFDPLLPIIMPDPCKPYVMVFVSAGPDGKLGFTGPLGAVTDENDLADNLWSIR